MKKTPILIFFTVIFSISFSKTLPSVFPLYYNYAYVIYDSHDQSDYLTPRDYYGKIQVHRNDHMEIQFRVEKGVEINIKMSVWLFDHEPTDEEVTGWTQWEPHDATINYNSPEDYDIYEFPGGVDTKGCNYIGLRFTPQQSVLHLTFFARSSFYNYIKDLNYNTNYYADMSIFPDGKFPSQFHYYIRIAVHSEDKMEIQLESSKIYTENSFKVDVCQYKYSPTTANVYGDYIPPGTVCNNITSTRIDKGSVYDTHITEFTTNKDISHLAIHIACYIPGQEYLKFYIFSETGLAIAIIVIIVVVCVAVVGGGVGYGVKRYRRRDI